MSSLESRRAHLDQTCNALELGLTRLAGDGPREFVSLEQILEKSENKCRSQEHTAAGMQRRVAALEASILRKQAIVGGGAGDLAQQSLIAAQDYW